MSAPMVIFPDPLIVATGILRDGLPSVYTPTVQVGTVAPEKRPQASQGLPYVQVSADNLAGQYPVTETASLRVGVYAATEADTFHLAQLCKAILLAFPGSAEVRGCSSTTGPTPATDPDTGSPFAFFPVAVRLRPITL